MAVTTPRSGQVPTATTVPFAVSRSTALPSRVAEPATENFLVTSLAPMRMIAASGAGPATNMAST